MNNIQRITVEVDGESPFEYVIAKQGEANSRIVEIELMEKSVAYNILEGVKAMVKYRKPDGKKVLNDCTYSGNIVTVTYTEQMLAAYGTGKGEIMLVKGTEIIKSATFWTKVVETVYKENGLISDDELVSLAGTLIEVNQTLEKIDSAVTGAETAVEEAEQALQQAEEMQQSCTAATENANQAAENCNTATADMQQKCNEAVESANAATTAAENATENANKATADCNAAIADMQQKCNEAVESANAATTAAEEVTENANQITADCNTAIQNATAATEGANQAAEKCNDIIDGLTPRIGEDGNWYVGKEDTGVKANGGITVYDGFDSESTINAASARTVKDLKEGLESHTHTRSEITDFPTTMKNPNALTVKFNGTSQGTYDGSIAKEIDITPSGIGAAASSHTHSYAGSSSAGGAANSAVKLQTPRTITIGNQSQPFDGSKNIAFNEKSMGLLKIARLQGVSSSSTYGAEFARIKCKGQRFISSYETVTPKDFFMIVNQAYGNMGGYYMPSSGIVVSGMTPTSIGGSGCILYLRATLSDDNVTITLCSTTTIPVTVLYDAEKVEVIQL